MYIYNSYTRFIMQVERSEWSVGDVLFYLRRPFAREGNTQVWGFPLNHGELLNKEWNDDTLNSISGYYIAVRTEKNTIVVVNDILGGYRLYYARIDGKWCFSDDYQYLLKRLNCKPTIDELQLKYWMNHRYTLSSGTLFNEIKKLPPATRLTVNVESLEVKSYFNDYENTPCYKRLMEKGYSVISEQLCEAYKNNRHSTFLLFYSGGTDSTFLLKTLQKLKIPFECVLIRYSPRWSVSEKEYSEAINKLRAFGITDFKTLDVDLNEAINNHVETAAKEMLFDRHLSVHFYETYKRVMETWGDDVVIVNGQSADSILSYGPSDLIPGFFVKRCILYSNWLTNLILDPLIRIYLNNEFRMPWTRREKLRSMLDEWEYFFAIRRNCPYVSLLNRTLDDENVKRLKHFASKRMYLKIISFLQGPDNQIVIQAANHFGINKVIMPFTAPAFIYNVVRNKSNIREIFKGKYFVRDHNKKVYHLEPPKLTTVYEEPRPDFDMHSYETKILEIYNDYVNQITSI